MVRFRGTLCRSTVQFAVCFSPKLTGADASTVYSVSGRDRTSVRAGDNPPLVAEYSHLCACVQVSVKDGRCDWYMVSLRGRTPAHVRTGFTLVELVVVIVVLALLGGVAIPKFVNYGNRARMTAYITHTNRLYAVCSQYEVDYGVYDSGGELEPWTVTSATIASTPLADRFTGGEFTAFGGTWFYALTNDSVGDGQTDSFISGGSLPLIGSFPSAGHEFIAIVTSNTGNESIDPGTENTPYTSVYAAGWSVTEFPMGPLGYTTDDVCVGVVRQWTK